MRSGIKDSQIIKNNVLYENRMAELCLKFMINIYTNQNRLL